MVYVITYKVIIDYKPDAGDWDAAEADGMLAAVHC